MSEQPIDTSVRIDPNEEITPEKKVILLTQWKEKVEAEIADYNQDREKVVAAYKEQKERFDKILGKKTKQIKKLDSLLNGRKKVLMDINKEIDIAAKQPDTNDQAPQ